MTSFTNGLWVFENPECPACNTLRLAQGFTVTVDENNPLCSSHAAAKQTLDYIQSVAYQAWLASIPEGLSISEQGAWITANPPPGR